MEQEPMTLQQKIDEAANNWNKTMDIIVLNDGLYQLLPVSKQILDGIVLTGEISCLDLCDILRLKLSGYVDTLNLHVMNDDSGYFVGCMCR